MKWLFPILVLTMLTIAGCQPRQGRVYDDPYRVMFSQDDEPRARVSALRDASRRFGHTSRHKTQMERLMVKSRQPVEFYEIALRDLIQLNEADAIDFCKASLPNMKYEPAIDVILAEAGRRQWKEMTGVIIERAAKLRVISERAGTGELNALTSIHPGESVPMISWRVFENLKGVYPGHESAAGWSLFSMLVTDREQVAERLMEMKQPHSLAIDLQRLYQEFGVLPVTMEQIIWGRSLLGEDYNALRERARVAFRRLKSEQQAGMELRHLAVLIYCVDHHPELLSLSQADIAALIIQKLAQAKTQDAKTTFDDKAAVKGNDIRKLSYPDLLTLHVALMLMEQRDFVSVLFDQAELDLQTTDTELGGLIVFNDGGMVTAKLYPPELRTNDMVYVAPARLIHEGYEALFHYHFHAQSHDNAEYAGPGKGDLVNIGQRHNFSGLVFTFIKSDVMNVDYYQSGPVVVDLGQIKK